jgi:hypothetical protein
MIKIQNVKIYIYLFIAHIYLFTKNNSKITFPKLQ